jgi:predicted aspartyl protease
MTPAGWYASTLMGQHQMPVQMLVDTGATITLISGDVYDRMGLPKPRLGKTNVKLIAADGSAILTRGSAVMQLNIAGRVFKHSESTI